MRNMVERKNKVSILVISKNAKNTIRRLIDSILAQTYPNIELVCVDSSNDGTEQILEESKNKSQVPFKLIFQEPKGCGAARNEAFRNASGDIITALDSDDYIPSDYIEKLVKPFNERNNVIGVYVNGLIVSSGKTLFSELVKLYEDITLFKDELFYDNSHKYLIATVREIGEAAGEYDDAEVAEDLIHGKRVDKALKEFMAKGYVFETVDTYFISERQSQIFGTHWKKCMWYAKALVNKNYLVNYKREWIIKVVSSAYISLLPFMLLILIVQSAGLITYGMVLAPLLLVFGYLGYKAVIKSVFTWKLMLLPAYLYYRALFTFTGLIYEVLKKAMSIL
jgi:glycosyltransferase involved in cell wall biosynthesis